MFKKIVFGTDFSDLATRALTYVKQFPKDKVEEIVVMHVIDEHALFDASALISGFSTYSSRINVGLKEEIEAIAQKNLRQIQTELETLGFTVKTLIITGVPHQELVKIADKEDATLIVIGSHGKGLLKGALLGSVSENVLRHSNKPVLMIKLPPSSKEKPQE
jgi:nucleotide-binding universal stress UspA family protein